MEKKKTIDLWKEGDYTAKGGYFVRSEIKTFFNKLIVTIYQ